MESTGIQHFFPVKPRVTAEYFISGFTGYGDGRAFLISRQKRRREASTSAMPGRSCFWSGDIQRFDQFGRVEFNPMVVRAQLLVHPFDPWRIRARLEGMGFKMFVVVHIIDGVGVHLSLARPFVVIDGERGERTGIKTAG